MTNHDPDFAPAGRLEGRPTPREGRLLVLGAVLAAAVNLRIAIAAVGPLIERIRDDLMMSSTLAGVLNAIPFACLGIFALLGPSVLGRHSVARVVAACLGLIALFTVARAAAPAASILLAATVPIGFGIALISVTLPGVVKARFPVRMGRASGYYTAAMSIGAAIAALCVVPLAEVIGGWRPALALTAVPAVAALPIWLRRNPELGRRAEDAWRLVRPSREQIVLGLVLAAVAIAFLGTVSWVAAIYLQAGWSASAAAAVLAAILLGSAPASLVLPGLSDGRRRTVWTAAAAAVMAVGVAGFALAPTFAAPLWVLAFAIGNGAVFPLALTLPLDVSVGREEVVRSTAWALAIGFVLGASGPIWIGALRDATGGFTLPMLLLALLCAAGGLLALTLNRAAGPGPSRTRSSGL